MDGLKIQGRLVDIHQLHQGVPGGVVFPLPLRQRSAKLLPPAFGRRQRVVPVPHGEGQRAVLGCVAVFFPLEVRVGEGVQGRLGRFPDRAVCPPARHMAAAKHQVKVI